MSPITNVLPLSLVLIVSLVKEAFEDWVSAALYVYCVCVFLGLCLLIVFLKHIPHICTSCFPYVKQKRFQNDMAINNNPVEVLHDQKWETIPWKKLQVGDVVRVSMQHLGEMFSNWKLCMRISLNFFLSLPNMRSFLLYLYSFPK